MRLGNMAKVADKSVFEWLIDGFDVKTEFDVSADRYHDHLVGMRYAKVESFVVVPDKRLAKGGSFKPPFVRCEAAISRER